MISSRSILILAVAASGAGVFFARLNYSAMPVSPKSNIVSKNTEDMSHETGLLAFVGDESISDADIRWEAALHTSVPKIVEDERPVSNDSVAKIDSKEDGELSASDSLSHRLLVTMIERKLLYQWIKNYSEGFDHQNPSRYLACLSEAKELTEKVGEFFSATESKERLKSHLCERSLIDQYLNEKVWSSLKVSESEIITYYRTHQEQFKQPQRVIFRQILLPTESAVAEIKPKINRSNFAELAAAHSIAPEAKDGGKLGPFRRDQLPTFFDIVFNMQIGEISGILRSSYGFHVIMLLERLPPTTLSLSEAKPSILKHLETGRKQTLFQAWLTTAMNIIPVRSNVGEKNL